MTKNILCFAILFLMFGCSSKIQIRSIELEPHVENVLRKIIKVETNANANVKIHFWDVEKKQMKLMETSEPKSKHEITLVGLKQNTKYNYQVEILQNRKSQKGEILSFETSGLPKDVPQYTLSKENPNLFEGYILFTHLVSISQNRNLPNLNNPTGSARNPETYDSKSKEQGTFLIMMDSMGEIVWYDMVDENIRPFNWTRNGTIIVLQEERSLREYDVFGNLLLEFNKDDFEGGIIFDRDAMIDQDNNIVTLAYKEEKKKFANQKKEIKLNQDVIYVIDREGQVLNSWKFTKMDTLQPYKTIYSKQQNANSIYLDEKDGNYIVSFRDLNQIWKIDAQNGEPIWKLGEGGSIAVDEEVQFKGQHNASKSINGDILVFDNGLNHKKRKPNDVLEMRSRGLGFTVDEHNKVARNSVSIELGKDYSSLQQSSFTQINDDLFLFCSSYNHRIFFTDRLGNILWEFDNLVSSFKVEYIPSFFDVKR